MAKRKPWTPDSEIRLAAAHVFGFNLAARQHGLAPGEETLTDSMMLGLKRRRFPFVHFRGRMPDARSLFVHQFNLDQEKRVGADWNLLLKTGTSRVNFRIQAKRLYGSGQYTQKKAKQHKRLLEVSEAQGAVPLYAFYNGPVPGGVHSACVFPDQERLGCTVVPAVVASGAGSPPWSNSGIGCAAIPIECLFACHCFGGGWRDAVRPPLPGGAKVELARPVTPASAIKALELSAISAKLDVDPDDLRVDSPMKETSVIDAWLETGDPGGLDRIQRETYADVSHLVVAVADLQATLLDG